MPKVGKKRDTTSLDATQSQTHGHKPKQYSGTDRETDANQNWTSNKQKIGKKRKLNPNAYNRKNIYTTGKIPPILDW